MLKVAKTTVHNVLQKFNQTGSTANLPKSVRPGATSATDDHAIRRMVEKTPKLTAPEVNQALKDAGITISDQTIRNRLHDAGFMGRRARCKPLISAKNRRARLEFARAHVDKPKSYWEKVLRTDETKINMFQSMAIAQCGDQRTKLMIQGIPLHL